MILVSKQRHHGSTEFAPATDDRSEFLRGLSPVTGKPVQATFDGGRLTSDTGILLLAGIEHRLGIAERLAGCLTDPRSPERIQHPLTEMIRFRTLMIAAGYPYGNDSGTLRTTPTSMLALVRTSM